MNTHLVNLVIDAARPRVLADFWAALLGWRVAVEEPDEVDVRAPEADGWDLDLVFVPVPEAKVVKNRVHLDLASKTPEHQEELVARALDLGGRRVDVGQGAVPWVVLADPEGNEFCVLEPREQYMDTGAVASILVDSRSPARLAEFWAGITGWPVRSQEGEVIVGLRTPSGRGPWLEFLRNEDVKQVKNRVHLDVAPPAGADHAAAVSEVLAAGALAADVGAPTLPWRVLTDPEGNEFCVLTPR
ncbi:VOC family protein [Amycolatopsis sp., V23-08]|uniref:VOC family protein n=1 Tax=Amycolatopsis heterodermiae TaxID=3110235 RepID=A0ABU5RER1_9PSEU|nr:VOC family protein [Amycolatopsis sp., V23-08]MEA5364770.1 VOC family protein [Amycolatopsis sp., V23-08]